MNSHGQINPAIIQALRGTTGWVRFMRVTGFILTALMILGGVAMMAMGRESMLGWAFLLVGVMYICFGLRTLFSAIKLNQYASQIGDFLRMPNEVGLATALDAQRGFWKLIGIMAIIVISL